MKKIYYIIHTQVPSKRAASVFVAKSMEAFASLGHRAIILNPSNSKAESVVDFYNLKSNVEVKRLFNFIKNTSNRLSFYLSMMFFSLNCLFYGLKHFSQKDLIITRENLSAFFLSHFFKNLIYEVHDYPEKNIWLYKRLFKKVKMIVVTNSWKKSKLVEDFSRYAGLGYIEKKVLVARNGIDTSEFDLPLGIEEAREKLRQDTGFSFLNNDSKIALYTGHLFDWKGVDTLALCADGLTDWQIVFVGGSDSDIKKFKDRFGQKENIHIVGHRPHAEIALWQRAANVLVLPNTAKQDISKFYTSPLKLFEYMASQTPIVASDIPSITEILNVNNSVLVKPDDVNALVKGIKEADMKGLEISNIARKDVEEFSWTNRAKMIVNNFSN